MKSSLIWFSLLFSVCCLNLVHAEQANSTPAIYYQIEEPFTINFQNQSQKQVQYLQVKVALMSHQAQAINNAEQNLPMIQDALRTLFTRQQYDDINTLEGRQQLQQEALALVSGLLQDETSNGQLDQVYFTSFILQ